ncbi:hypothetical protein LguiA_005117 [Lonicera macranthoides]
MGDCDIPFKHLLQITTRITYKAESGSEWPNLSPVVAYDTVINRVPEVKSSQRDFGASHHRHKVRSPRNRDHCISIYGVTIHYVCVTKSPQSDIRARSYGHPKHSANRNQHRNKKIMQLFVRFIRTLRQVRMFQHVSLEHIVSRVEVIEQVRVHLRVFSDAPTELVVVFKLGTIYIVTMCEMARPMCREAQQDEDEDQN